MFPTTSGTLARCQKGGWGHYVRPTLSRNALGRDQRGTSPASRRTRPSDTERQSGGSRHGGLSAGWKKERGGGGRGPRLKRTRRLFVWGDWGSSEVQNKSKTGEKKTKGRSVKKRDGVLRYPPNGGRYYQGKKARKLVMQRKR